MSLTWTLKAEHDLLDIADYVSDRSSHTALALLARIEVAIDQLSRFPFLGRERTALTGVVRSWTVDDWIILYTVAADGRVTIGRIVHGSRDLRRIWQEH